MSEFLIGCTMIIGTYGIYLLSRKLHQKIGHTFTAPVFVTSIILVVILLVFRIPYDTYMIGGKWINELLGPAVVALAYPLYQQRDIMKKLIVPITVGTSIGAVVGVATGILLSKLIGIDEMLIHSLTPKSVTMPVAIAVAETIEGVPSLTGIFVMIAGFGGVLFSPIIFKLFQVHSPIGKGVGLGSASHAFGTAKSFESSSLVGSVSTVAMILSAVIVSIITPGIVDVLL